MAADLAKPPELDVKDQSKCKVAKSQTRPLIVEWPSADRGALEAQLTKGTVVVRYHGCEMEVLRRCRAPGDYDYIPITRKRDRITMRDADDLYANIPLGAASLEGKLARSGELTVTMTMVGSYEAKSARVRQDQLTGDCGGATHVVTALTAGAFSFFAGADAEIGGGVDSPMGGAKSNSSASREILNEDGDEQACDASSAEDPTPPHNCGALLRIEVAPLVAAAPAPQPQPQPAPAATDAGPPAVPPSPTPQPVAGAGKKVINVTGGVIASVQGKPCGASPSQFAPYPGSTIPPGRTFTIPATGGCVDLAIVNGNGNIIARQNRVDIMTGEWTVK